MFMTMAEYALHRGVSRMRISQYCKDGMIPPRALVKKNKGGKHFFINVEKADLALSRGLSPPEPGKEEQQQDFTEIEEEAQRELDDFLRDDPLPADFFDNGTLEI